MKALASIIACIAACSVAACETPENVKPQVVEITRMPSYTGCFVDGFRDVRMEQSAEQEYDANSGIFIKLADIDTPGGRCQIMISSKSSSVLKSGWLKVGEYVTFAKEEVGDHGVQLLEVDRNVATLRFRSGYAMTGSAASSPEGSPGNSLPTPHDIQILDARREILLLNVRQAMLACKVIQDPASMKATREDGVRMLEDVMNNLRRLEASLDPNNPRSR